MNRRLLQVFRLSLLGAIAFSLTACVTYHQPRYGDDGVYFDQTRYQPRTVVVADPLLYPYWSLDYFYFSRYYHPYSVLVPAYDPWFYPYPGWYYGYRPGPHSGFAFSGGFYYPWHGFGYVSYRPWRPYAVRYPHSRHYPVHAPSDRVHQIDERLRAIDDRERVARTARPTTRPGGPASRSEAMLRHRLAEDRANSGARRSSAAPAPARSSQREPMTRPAATRRIPSMQSSRQRSQPSRPSRQERRPPRTDQSQGIDLSAFNAERQSAPVLRVRPTEPQSRPEPTTRMTAPPPRPASAVPQQDPTSGRALQSRPAPSTRAMRPASQPSTPQRRPTVNRSRGTRDRDRN
ncbi:MAG: hypothetical protein V2J42_04705 [Wenzhouxiangella sp.]|jgi:hypothetical protein|nr:hypothetical protein [Wenzhouxiangella sp.]